MEKFAKMSIEHETAVFGENQFTDLTADEFRAQYLYNMSAFRTVREEDVEVRHYPQRTAADPTPTSWDWDALGRDRPIRNQGNCGSCWYAARVPAALSHTPPPPHHRFLYSVL